MIELMIPKAVPGILSRTKSSTTVYIDISDVENAIPIKILKMKSKILLVTTFVPI